MASVAHILAPRSLTYKQKYAPIAKARK